MQDYPLFKSFNTIYYEQKSDYHALQSLESLQTQLLSFLFTHCLLGFVQGAENILQAQQCSS